MVDNSARVSFFSGALLRFVLIFLGHPPGGLIETGCATKKQKQYKNNPQNKTKQRHQKKQKTQKKERKKRR